MALPEVETDSTVAFGDEYFISGDKNKQPALDNLRDRYESGEISETEAKEAREAIRRSPSGKSAADYLGDALAFVFGASGDVSRRDAKIAAEDAAVIAANEEAERKMRADFTGPAPMSAEYSDGGQKVTMHVPASPTTITDPMNPVDGRTPPHVGTGEEPPQPYSVQRPLDDGTSEEVVGTEVKRDSKGRPTPPPGSLAGNTLLDEAEGTPFVGLDQWRSSSLEEITDTGTRRFRYRKGGASPAGWYAYDGDTDSWARLPDEDQKDAVTSSHPLWIGF